MPTALPQLSEQVAGFAGSAKVGAMTSHRATNTAAPGEAEPDGVPAGAERSDRVQLIRPSAVAQPVTGWPVASMTSGPVETLLDELPEGDAVPELDSDGPTGVAVPAGLEAPAPVGVADDAAEVAPTGGVGLAVGAGEQAPAAASAAAAITRARTRGSGRRGLMG